MGSCRAILDWLTEQREPMLRLLEDVVNIDSGSHDKAGVDAVGSRFLAFFAEHGIRSEVQAQDRFGDVITATVGGGAGRPILLLGHRDTVFGQDEAARRPFRTEDGRAYGPGVADMKAGLVMNAFVLAAFRHFDGARPPLKMMMTSDEEIASPACRPVIEAAARGAGAVFNAEPGRPSGNVVTGRKGGVFMECTVFGKASHAGGSFEAGASAITELAYKVVQLAAVTDLPAGVTLNVGLVSGGQSVNTVAPKASAGIDLRYVRPEQRDQALSQVEAIVAHSTVPGTRAELRVTGEFLPLVPDDNSRDLFAVYREAAAELGFAVDGEFSGGCADSGLTASAGCPTLCAVGPIGGRTHTAREYTIVDTLVSRAQILALTISRLKANE